ncbi:hypothetical protein ACFXTH_001321 [Malus domestica]
MLVYVLIATHQSVNFLPFPSLFTLFVLLQAFFPFFCGATWRKMKVGPPQNLPSSLVESKYLSWGEAMEVGCWEKYSGVA